MRALKLRSAEKLILKIRYRLQVEAFDAKEAKRILKKLFGSLKSQSEFKGSSGPLPGLSSSRVCNLNKRLS